MKSYLAFCLGLLSMTCSALAQDDPATEIPQPTTRIEDCRTGKEIQVDELVLDLARCDVVFLGEQHDNDSGHQFQLSVIQALVEQGRSVAISTEQFERDVQGAVDDYLGDRIDEVKFLHASRPWKNYRQHYRPIIEFAKEQKIPLLAANIPRQVASDVAAGKEIALSSKPFAPRFSTTPKNAYWQNFAATMKGHLGADGADKLALFYASQCLKDDAMAETITDYLAKNSHENKIVVHLCGHFHSDYGLGTVARVVQRMPLIRFSVATMELQSLDAPEPDLAKIRSRAHYVFWSVQNPKTEKGVETTTDGIETSADGIETSADGIETSTNDR